MLPTSGYFNLLCVIQSQAGVISMLAVTDGTEIEIE